MKNARSHQFLAVALAVLTQMLSGCEKHHEPAPHIAQTESSAASADKTTATGSITATPNPIQVCDGSGLGKTTITPSSQGASLAEIRLGAPNGTVFASGFHPAETGKWVRDGMTFYLQDISPGRPLTQASTIAQVTIHVTKAGCR